MSYIVELKDAYRFWIEGEGAPNTIPEDKEIIDIVCQQDVRPYDCFKQAIESGVINSHKHLCHYIYIHSLKSLGSTSEEIIDVLKLLSSVSVGISYFCTKHIMYNTIHNKRSYNIKDCVEFYETLREIDNEHEQTEPQEEKPQAEPKPRAARKSAGGRPRKYTPEQHNEAFAMKEQGATWKEVVKKTGISKETLLREKERRAKQEP